MQLAVSQSIKLFRNATGDYDIFNTDCFKWIGDAAPNSVHAIVTDPPYGLIEYTPEQLLKLRSGRGGVWRVPPTFDGVQRSPLPRFTVLNRRERETMRQYFEDFARLLLPVLVPGAHIFIATNPLVSNLVYDPLVQAGFEKRGEIIRVIQTLRGGDRPKNAHEEFADVTVMPRSCWEPWGLFRKPCEGRVQDNLRKWRTGGLRRVSPSEPFRDILFSCKRLRKADRPTPNLETAAFPPSNRARIAALRRGNLA